jgi:hypothetical protein
MVIECKMVQNDTHLLLMEPSIKTRLISQWSSMNLWNSDIGPPEQKYSHDLPLVKKFSTASAKVSYPPSPRLAMHLMYTLDEEGNRVYTLKVRLYRHRHFSWYSRLPQKVTDAGKTTKSAHPGASEMPESSVFETYHHDLCASSILT